MHPDPPDNHGLPTGDYKPTGDNSHVHDAPQPALPPGERAGDRIGPYKLLQKLGEGGMGAVWSAEQSAPVRRRVAIKIIKADVASAHALARFEQERQALALMDHPNIAKVFDAGVSPPVATGGHASPYIVMELIKGVPITKYCDDAKLTPRQRLELFIPVCQAVQHAHQKGIIHRDLKPSNVLIALYDGRPVPKVIDFGVAKATGPRLTEQTMYTEVGNIIGTLEYMAPEQAELNNLDIDTRADIYSLGVILYELLTGSVPFSRKELQAAGLGEMLRAIHEVEPPKPSTKISSSQSLPAIAAVRQMEPRKLTQLVRGELDWITMKALEKERTRRYETANGLALDIQRFLNDEPIQARPISRGRRLVKWAKRRPASAALYAATALFIIVGLVGGIAYFRQQAAVERDRAVAEKNADRRARAEVLVQALASADTAETPRLVSELLSLRDWAETLLRDRFAKAPADSKEKLHAALALLPYDPTVAAPLVSRLTTTDTHQVPVIAAALAEHARPSLASVVAKAFDPNADARERLRSAVALAVLDPKDSGWPELAPAVADALVHVNPFELPPLAKAFDSVRDDLIPALAAQFRTSQAKLKTPGVEVTDIVDQAGRLDVAAALLTRYAADRPEVLADLVADAEERHFAVFFPLLKAHGERGLPVLLSEIEKTLPPELPSSDDKRETLAKRQANAAVALLRMNQPAKVWPLLKHSPDPRVRSYLIHRLSPLGADAKAIVKQSEDETDITIRRAMLLSLGEFNEKEMSLDARQALLPKLQEIYRAAPDSGLHAAAEWLLRTWKQEAWLLQVNGEWAKASRERQRPEKTPTTGPSDSQVTTSPPVAHAPGSPNAKKWFVNTQGQTMIVIPGPVEFLMGSPPTEAGRSGNEPQHKKRIGRTFALAAKAVTLAEYQRFDRYYGGDTKQWSRTPDSPVVAPTWFQAVEYCNWLSKQEGLPEREWCYEPLIDPKAMPALAASTVGLLGSPLGQGALSAASGVYPDRTDPEYTGGMKLAGNYLKRTGYRLPTEAEMEYATRAGALTSRYYGETEELLPKYAWYNKNGKEHSWPVASLKPNDLGFFDVHGNAFTWCQERFKSYPSVNGETEDQEDALDVKSTNIRVLRGGSFSNQPSNVRSANRNDDVPTLRNYNIGFRPSRTLTP